MYLYELANVTGHSTTEVVAFFERMGIKHINVTNDWVDPVLADCAIDALNPPRKPSLQNRFRDWALDKFAAA